MSDDDNHEPFTRGEVQAWERRALYFSKYPQTVNEGWKRVYRDLAHALNVLDAFIARSQWREGEPPPPIEGWRDETAGPGV